MRGVRCGAVVYRYAGRLRDKLTESRDAPLYLCHVVYHISGDHDGRRHRLFGGRGCRLAQCAVSPP